MVSFVSQLNHLQEKQSTAYCVDPERLFFSWKIIRNYNFMLCYCWNKLIHLNQISIVWLVTVLIDKGVFI